MTGLKSYALDEADNTQYMPENQNPSSVNDGVRQLQADLAEDYRDREWTEYGQGVGAGDGSTDYDCSYESATQFTIAQADVTEAYHVGRQVRVIGTATGTIYGTIVSTDYDDDLEISTIEVAWDDDAELQSETGLRVWLSTLSATGTAIPMAAINGRPIDMQGEPLTQPQLVDYSETRQTLVIDFAAVTWDLADGNTAYLKLTEDVSSITITGWPGNPVLGSATLIVQQDATGGWTATGWPAEVVWLGGGVEPIFSLAAHSADLVLLITLDGGANILGSYGQTAPFAMAIG